MPKKQLSYDERHARSRYRYGICIPTRRCNRFTPHGEIEGMECPVGDKVYHNTTLSGAEAIANDERIRITDKGALGQDAISLSPCPAQHYGGNVKLVIDTKGLELRPTCYYEYEGQNKETDHSMEREGQQQRNGYVGINRVRAKYGVNLSMYNEECEVISYKDIPTKKIKQLEYWIPWRVDERNTFSTKCVGAYPSYAHGEFGDILGKLKENILSAKKVAKKLGVKFAVKSCYTALQTDPWGGDKYIPLTDKNLNLLAQDKQPIEKKVPIELREDKIYGLQRIRRIPEKCKC